RQVANWRNAGESIALVPTMGAQHEGHLSLVRTAGRKADRVIVSIFVNPAQFAPTEDFGSYPRQEKSDLDKLAPFGVDLVFAPNRDEVYPPDFSTGVSVGGLTECLCGVSRPHFFGGVATVVSKLLNQAQPDIAIFGEKDYQQLLVIRRMARDLDIPVKILGGAIVRENDGLALSSRNAYLSAAERARAPLLNRNLRQVAGALAAGGDQKKAVAAAKDALADAGFRLDYLEVRHAGTLDEVDGSRESPARVFGAAFLGKTRLIDNVPVRLKPGNARR
ncbi:MAG: pantoate--beta-alanine ligase, partial [Hyphomicrobiales bacterium]